MYKSLLFAPIFFFVSQSSIAQKNDSTVVREIFDAALTKGEAYEDLRSLCKDIGARFQVLLKRN